MGWLWLACAALPPPTPPIPVPTDAGAARVADAVVGYRAALSSPDPYAALSALVAREAEPAAREALLAFLLDAELRRATGARADLDALVRAVGPEFDEAEWRATAPAVAGRPLAGWEAQRAGRKPLDYGGALDWFGLRFVPDDHGGRALVPDPGASGPARRHRSDWP
jgi:hypothetical protein